MQHQNYFQQKYENMKKAKRHTEEMNRIFPDSIKNSIMNTRQYMESDSFIGYGSTGKALPYIVDKMDSVSAALEYAGQGYKVCILNFASFKEPGGKFLEGSIAQEECLCHESTLYNVLSDKRFQDSYYSPNHKALNRALYKNRALYSPNIAITRDDDNIVFCDVLTCAAPNYKAANKYQNVSKEENTKVLRSRIRFILDIMAKEGVQVPILGAFGCGVFGQDAYEVAKIFKSCLDDCDYPFKKVSFAVIPGPNADAFEQVIDGNKKNEDIEVER